MSEQEMMGDGNVDHGGPSGDSGYGTKIFPD